MDGYAVPEMRLLELSSCCVYVGRRLQDAPIETAVPLFKVPRTILLLVVESELTDLAAPTELKGRPMTARDPEFQHRGWS